MEWKKNVLSLAAMAFVLGAGALGALVVGGLLHWDLEVMIPLAVTFGAAGASLIGLAGQVAQDSPPNHHKIAVDHEYRMAQLGTPESDHTE